MVTVYSTPTCAPCRVAKARLKQAGIPFREVDLTTEPEILADLKRRQGVELIQTPLIEQGGQLFTIAGLAKVIAAGTPHS